MYRKNGLNEEGVSNSCGSCTEKAKTENNISECEELVRY